MYLAAQEGQFEILELLVQKRRGNVKIKAYDGMSCLHAAAQSGHLDCVRFLVSTYNLISDSQSCHFDIVRFVVSIYYLIRCFLQLKSVDHLFFSTKHRLWNMYSLILVMLNKLRYHARF